MLGNRFSAHFLESSDFSFVFDVCCNTGKRKGSSPKLNLVGRAGPLNVASSSNNGFTVAVANEVPPEVF